MEQNGVRRGRRGLWVRRFEGFRTLGEWPMVQIVGIEGVLEIGGRAKARGCV
jgi:hypothetical protein